MARFGDEFFIVACFHRFFTKQVSAAKQAALSGTHQKTLFPWGIKRMGSKRGFWRRGRFWGRGRLWGRHGRIGGRGSIWSRGSSSSSAMHGVFWRGGVLGGPDIGSKSINRKINEEALGPKITLERRNTFELTIRTKRAEAKCYSWHGTRREKITILVSQKTAIDVSSDKKLLNKA